MQPPVTIGDTRPASTDRNAPPTGLEPATAGVETRSSIQLSYRGKVRVSVCRAWPQGDTLASRSILVGGVVGVAQLVRAPGCGPGGRGFESPRSPVESLLGAIPAPLAQLVEHRTLNPQVLGSSPRGCTQRSYCEDTTSSLRRHRENVRFRPGVLSFSYLGSTLP